eukprot:m.29781 g.29781  ORF g.29781 m.29781 type:complete len:283 (+) comp11975_c0_seq1:2-850(+)
MEQVVCKLGRGAAFLGVTLSILVLAALTTPRWTIMDDYNRAYMGLWKVCVEGDCDKLICDRDVVIDDDDNDWSDCSSLHMARASMFVALALAVGGVFASIAFVRQPTLPRPYPAMACYSFCLAACIWGMMSWSSFSASLYQDTYTFSYHFGSGYFLIIACCIIAGIASVLVGRASRLLRYARYASLLNNYGSVVAVVTTTDTAPPAYPGPGGYQNNYNAAPPAYQPQPQQQQPYQQQPYQQQGYQQPHQPYSQQPYQPQAPQQYPPPAAQESAPATEQAKGY